jgi:hypothetical protein
MSIEKVQLLTKHARENGATKVIYQHKDPGGHMLHIELEFGGKPYSFSMDELIEAPQAQKKVQVRGADGLTAEQQKDLYGSPIDAKEEDI